MPGLFDGAFGRGGLLPYGADPFAVAALRMREAVRPEGGRSEGRSRYYGVFRCSRRSTCCGDGRSQSGVASGANGSL